MQLRVNHARGKEFNVKKRAKSLVAKNITTITSRISDPALVGQIMLLKDAEKIKYCRKLGADYAFNYKDHHEYTALKDHFPDGFDVIWNTSLQHDFKLLLPLLAQRGIYMLMSGLGNDAVLPVGQIYTKDASIKGFAITNATKAEYDQAAGVINSLLLENKLEVRIADSLSFRKDINS